MTPRPLDLSRPTALATPEKLVDWRLAVTWEAAVSSGLLDALPGTPEEIAETTGLDRGGIGSVCHLLAEWGLVTIGPDSRISLGPVRPSADQSAALAQHGVWIRRWTTLVGPRLRDRTASGPETLCRPDTATRLRLLASASARAVGPVVDACLRAAPEAPKVLDLGGGHGEYSIEFARRGLQVTMQDLPSVIEVARAEARLDRVELVAADVFDRVASGPFDLVLCSTITNMFDAAANREILRRVLPSLAPGGTLAIVSYMRDRGVVGAVFGVQMLVATDAGDAHGAADYRTWLAEEGYADVSAWDLADPPLSIVVGHAPSE